MKTNYVVAFDIGGTKIAGALFDDKYKVVKKKRVEFDKKKFESEVIISKNEFFAIICELVNELKADVKIMAIGVSIPDVVDREGSIVSTSKIKSLSNFPLGSELKKIFKCPVVAVANDADCFALGEQRLGAGQGQRNVIGVIFGTGIGAGIVLGGQIYAGTTGSAGEFGHNIVNPSGPRGRIGLMGTIEAYAGASDLVRNYLAAGGKLKEPDSKAIYDSSEQIAKKVAGEALVHFSIGLAALMNTLNPGIIILGGGQSNQPVYKELNRLTKKFTISGLRKNVKIVKNKLGDDAGIYGAAILARENCVI